MNLIYINTSNNTVMREKSDQTNNGKTKTKTIDKQI